MAGTDASFDRVAFEEGIRFAMRMGEAVHPERRPTFEFPVVAREYYRLDEFGNEIAIPNDRVRVDQNSRPLDPSISLREIRPAPIQVLCTVEYSDARPDELPVGVRIPTKLTLTFLEAEYQELQDHSNGVGPNRVIVSGDRYVISHRPPDLALFDAGVYQYVCFAEAES